MKIDVGFTGTRQGMSENQVRQFINVMRSLDDIGAFHHGGAVGADSEAAAFVHSIVDEVVMHEIGELGPLARNRDIVADSDIIIAAPESNKEELRSGTWATVRYARIAYKPVIMLSR